MPPQHLSVFLSGAVLAACAWSATARAEPVSAGTGIPPAAPTRVTPVAGGLEHPWAMAFLPDGGILITERPGNLRLLRIPGGLSAPLKAYPRWPRGAGRPARRGLVAGFRQDRLVYLSMPRPATAAPAPWDAATWPMTGPAWRISASCSGRSQAVRGLHFGSRLELDGKGYLYIALGENNQRSTAQDLGKLQGKIVRIRADGSVPPDNPFVGKAGARPRSGPMATAIRRAWR